MGPKIIPSDRAHRDSHPPFYEGDHWDYFLSLSRLSSNHYPSLQYLMPTSGGILYRALKLSKLPSKSTKLLNLPIPKKELEVLKR